MILAGDIGGTTTRLAWFALDGDRPRLVVSEQFASRNHPHLIDIVRAFLALHPQPVQAAAFGIAGPVREGRAVATNLPWVVDAANLAQELRLPTVGLLNDLAATTHGISALDESDLVTLQPGVADPRGAIGVIAAGTGLGLAGAVWTDAGYQVIPSEGGHADFAPRTELESTLCAHLRQQFGRVSIERVVSGQGLASIYDFLTATDLSDEPTTVTANIDGSDDRSAAIAQAGIGGASARCGLALNLFVAAYGAAAGNLALTLLATGGLYIGGGIAPRILPWLTAGGFIDAFTAKGRLTPVVASMPVRVVLNDQAALLGAGWFAARAGGLLAP